MELKFVNNLPLAASGQRKSKMRIEVLEQVIEALAGDAGTWAHYPWQQVRPDLAEEGLHYTDKRVMSHIRQVQQLAKESKEPFHEYDVEVAIRKSQGFIRVAPLTGYRNRNL